MLRSTRARVAGAVLSFCLLGGAAALLLFTVACGEGRPAPEGLPSQTDGVLDGRHEYASPAKGYALSVPSGWTDVPNNIELGSGSVDVFYSLAPTGKPGVAPTFSVSSEPVPPNTTSREFLESKLEFLSSVHADFTEPMEVEVAGTKGFLVDYEGYSSNYEVQSTSVVVVTGQQGWEFVLTVPAGERSQYRPLLAALLASVRLPSD